MLFFTLWVGDEVVTDSLEESSLGLRTLFLHGLVDGYDLISDYDAWRGDIIGFPLLSEKSGGWVHGFVEWGGWHTERSH